MVTSEKAFKKNQLKAADAINRNKLDFAMINTLHFHDSINEGEGFAPAFISLVQKTDGIIKTFMKKIAKCKRFINVMLPAHKGKSKGKFLLDLIN